MTLPAFPNLIGIKFPVNRTAIWSKQRQQAISGKRTSLSWFSYPLYQYEIAFEYLGSGLLNGRNNVDFQTLLGLVNQTNGGALPFTWNDPDDNYVAGQSLGTGDGVTTQFLFQRTLGGFTEPIQNVTAGTIVIEVAGSPTSAYTLLTDPNWGCVYGIAFTAAPASAAAITATFYFTWPCQFDDDKSEFGNFMFRFWELKKLTFTTMKVL
jgi:uncharacterized protein (TIGR02217 family)